MKKSVCLLSLVCSLSGAHALDVTPWLGDVYEFNLYTEAVYSRYRYVNGAVRQLSRPSNSYITPVSIGLTASPNVGVEIEGELAQTPRQSYGFRSAALGVRYRFLDDIAGDLVSFTGLFSTRLVTGRSVRDISSPYSSYWNQELGISVGKEILREEDWKLRSHVVGILGIANHRSLWNRALISLEGSITDEHVIQCFARGYFGYGNKKYVDIQDFHGWGTVHHQSVDLGLQYRYRFFLMGDLGVSYVYRVYARLYPERAKLIELSYSLPFSMF